MNTICGFVFLFVLIIYALAAPTLPYLPTAGNILMFVLTLVLITTIRNNYARTVFAFWAFWFVIGAVSLFAQNRLWVGLNYNLDASVANDFYLSCVCAAVLGGALMQIAIRGSHEIVPAETGVSSIYWTLLLSFPLAYVLSIIVSTGSIPLLSGEDISATMYERSYGPLYSFGVYVVVACLILWMHIQSWRKPFPVLRNLLAWPLLLTFLVASSFDGRRVLTILSVVGMLIYYVALPRTVYRWLGGAIMVLAMLMGYLVGAALRSGRQVADAFGSFWSPLAAVGTEYRDFTYGFAVVPRSAVLHSGYDWLGSTVAAVVPSFLLKLAGFDKDAFIAHDSARTLMEFWNVNLGIRIGLPGELWFAYGWAAIAIFPLFGAGVVLLAELGGTTRHFVYKAILLTGLSLSALAVNGQSTVTFGLILPLLYLAAAIAVFDWALRRSSGRMRRRSALAP